MNTSTTALSLDSIDHAVDVVVLRQRQRGLPRGPAARPLQQSANVIAVAAITPLVLTAFAILILVFAVKLSYVLVAAGFEN